MADGPSNPARLRMKGESSVIFDETITYAQVRLRIEGKSGNIFEGDILTRGKVVYPATGASHLCDGSNGQLKAKPSLATAITALADAAQSKGFPWDAVYHGDIDDYMITSIKDTRAQGDFVWNIYVQYRPIGVARGCHKVVQCGDEVLFAFHNPNAAVPLLMLSGPQSVDKFDKFSAVVINGLTGAVVPGVQVSGIFTGKNGTATPAFKDYTDYNGTVKPIAPASAGILTFKATGDGMIPSNTIIVKVNLAKADA